MSAEPVLRRTDVKAFFANERTFLHWLSTSVTLGTISSALAGVVGHSKLSVTGPTTNMLAVQCVATAMVLVSIIMAIMATANFYIRGRYLVLKVDGPYYSRILPVIVTVMMTITMVIVMAGTVASYISDSSSSSTPTPTPSPRSELPSFVNTY